MPVGSSEKASLVGAKTVKRSVLDSSAARHCTHTQHTTHTDPAKRQHRAIELAALLSKPMALTADLTMDHSDGGASLLIERVREEKTRT